MIFLLSGLSSPAARLPANHSAPYRCLGGSWEPCLAAQRNWSRLTVYEGKDGTGLCSALSVTFQRLSCRGCGSRGRALASLCTLTVIAVPSAAHPPVPLSTQPLKCKTEGFPGGTVVKNPPANAGDTGSGPGPGRSHMPRSN